MTLFNYNRGSCRDRRLRRLTISKCHSGLNHARIQRLKSYELLALLLEARRGDCDYVFFPPKKWTKVKGTSWSTVLKAHLRLFRRCRRLHRHHHNHHHLLLCRSFWLTHIKNSSRNARAPRSSLMARHIR